MALVGLVLWAGHALLAGVAERAGVPSGRLRLLRRIGPSLTLTGTAVSGVSSALVATGSIAAVTDVLQSRSGAFRRALLVAAVLGTAPPAWAAKDVPLALVAVMAEAASGHAAGPALVQPVGDGLGVRPLAAV